MTPNNESNGRILRASKPYEGRVHDFEIHKTEGSLPAVPILVNPMIFIARRHALAFSMALIVYFLK